MAIERSKETTETTETSESTKSEPAPTDTSVEHSTTETERTEVKTGDSDDGA